MCSKDTTAKIIQKVKPKVWPNVFIHKFGYQFGSFGSHERRGSVTDVAIRTLKILYPNLVDRRCFSHTLDHVGEKMETPIFVSVFEGVDKSFCSLFKKQNYIQNTNRTKPRNPLSY